MKRVIVAGANGFIGTAFVKELLSQGIEVLCLTKGADVLPEDVVKIEFNLSNVQELYQNADIKKDYYDTFYNFAWQGSAGEARIDTGLQLDNAKWSIDLLKYAHDIGCSRFVGAGSIMEDETIAACFAQENRPGEAYIYSDGKLVAHFMGKSVAAKLGIDFVWVKITNAYGPNEISPRFINTTLRKIINNEDLQFTAATQNYDFVYIDDVAEAFYLIGKNGKAFGEYIIGSSDAKPLREFITEIVATLAPDRKPLFGDIPFTGINLPLETFDTEITETVTGFKAKTPFSEGIKNTMEWLKQLRGKDD